MVQKLDRCDWAALVIQTLFVSLCASFVFMTIATVCFIGLGWPDLKQTTDSAVVLAISCTLGLVIGAVLFRHNRRVMLEEKR